MTNYPRSAYGTRNPNAGRPANGDFGAWGGYKWPNCAPASLMGTTDYTSKFGQRLRVQLRSGIVPLAGLMFAIADKHGYVLYSNHNGENWGPWGMECRAISGTNNPSGHSGGLAMDWNAPFNPYSTTFQSDMPPAMVADIETCGWFWGGRYEGQKYDAMHFSYCYGPGDVARHMDVARQILGGGGGGGGQTPDEIDEALIMTKADDIINLLNGVMGQVKAVNTRLDQLPVAIWTTPITGTAQGQHANELLATAVAQSGGAVQAAQVAADIAQKNRRTILGPPEGKDRLGDLWNQGQEILEAVGGEITPPPPPTPVTTYTVVSGDTLSGIAKKLGVTLDALRAANPQITNPDAIAVGDVLNVPKA